MKLIKGKPDWLGELQGLLITVLVLAPLWFLGSVAYHLGNRFVGPEVPVGRVAGVVGASEGLRPGAEVAGGDQWVSVVIQEPTLGQLLAWLLTRLPSFALVLTVLLLLLQLVRQARRGDPFELATVRRLRVLALVTLAGVVLAALVETAAHFYLSNTVLTDGFAAQLQISGGAVLAGFGFLAVAEVVKRGCAMRDELATVI